MGSITSRDVDGCLPPSRPPSSTSSPPSPAANAALTIEDRFENSSSTHFASEPRFISGTPTSSTTSPSIASSSVPPAITGFSPTHSNHKDTPHHPLTSTASNEAGATPSASMDDEEVMTVPTLIFWEGDAHAVSISGSWDNWQRRVDLEPGSDGEHCVLLSLQPGDFQLKFFVDGTWQCASYLPTCADPRGIVNNLLTVLPRRYEFDTLIPLHPSRPSSPISSYDCRSPPTSALDPPLLPNYLEARSLKPFPDDISPDVCATRNNYSESSQLCSSLVVPRPAPPDIDTSIGPHASYRPFFSHVFIDHLYMTRACSNDHVQTISQTSRVGQKIVNTVFVFNDTSPPSSEDVSSTPMSSLLPNHVP